MTRTIVGKLPETVRADIIQTGADQNPGKRKAAVNSLQKGTVMTHGTIYLSSPVNALVEGIYEQNIPFTQVKKHGNFGLGTFNDLDGEMMMLDGHIYQITAEGGVNVIDEETLTPFSCVTFYKPVTSDILDLEMGYDSFLAWLNRLLPSANIFYAVRIEGVFAAVRTRSVPRQENYRPFVEVASEQTVFSFGEIEGTLAGFFTPPFMSSINVPGWHLHFLSTDLKHGGHLLECRPRNINVGVQFLPTLELALPIGFDYLTCDFVRDTESDLNKAEK